MTGKSLLLKVHFWAWDREQTFQSTECKQQCTFAHGTCAGVDLPCSLKVVLPEGRYQFLSLYFGASSIYQVPVLNHRCVFCHMHSSELLWESELSRVFVDGFESALRWTKVNFSKCTFPVKERV